MLGCVSEMGRTVEGKGEVRVLMSSMAPARLVKVPNWSTWAEVNELG